MRSHSTDPPREQLTAWLATFVTVLVAVLAVYVGAGIGDVIGASLLAYVLTVFAMFCKAPLRVTKVLAATGRGAVIAAVVTVVVLIGFVRAFRGL